MTKYILLLLSLAFMASRVTAQNVSAVMIHGHSMVPLRYVTEAFGASVSYNSRTRDIEISLRDQQVKMRTGNTAAIVGERRVMMDTAPVTMAGVTYVPVRFVSVNLGMNVTWMPENQRIRIVHPRSGKTIWLVMKEQPEYRRSPGHRHHGTPGHGGAPPGQIGNDHHSRWHGNESGNHGHESE